MGTKTLDTTGGAAGRSARHFKRRGVLDGTVENAGEIGAVPLHRTRDAAWRLPFKETRTAVAYVYLRNKGQEMR